jgi:DNA adenine methylase
MDKPFLKWPGGKRWVAEKVAALIRPSLRGIYFEPFLGGGAVFFALRPSLAVLSDVNEELVNTYNQVRGQPQQLVEWLRQLPVTCEAYYWMRAARPRTDLMRAVRFLYLNRTAFGGLYRVNRNGDFNVPYGGGERTPRILVESEILGDASKALSSTKVICQDFESAMSKASAGDVIYCDPTYTVAHNNNGFVRYNERNFSWDDQKRLARVAHACSKKGATVFLSNAVHPSITKLYKSAEVHTFARFSGVSTLPHARRTISEQLIVLRGAN